MKYKIIIREITETETQETVDVYVNKKTGEKLDWSKWYHLDEKEQRAFEIQKELTGKVQIDIDEKCIFEQEKEDLDVAELALHLNRVR